MTKKNNKEKERVIKEKEKPSSKEKEKAKKKRNYYFTSVTQEKIVEYQHVLKREEKIFYIVSIFIPHLQS